MSFERDFDTWLTTTPDDSLNPVSDCDTCGAVLYEGYEVIEFNGDYYCDTDCLLNSIDYLEITLCK